MQKQIAFLLNCFITNNFLNDTEIYQELYRISQQKNEKHLLLLLSDHFHQLPTLNKKQSEWQLVFTTYNWKNLVTTAKIICLLGYMLTFVNSSGNQMCMAKAAKGSEKLFVYASKIQPEQVYTYSSCNFMKGRIFISNKFFTQYFHYVHLPSFNLEYSWPETLAGFVQWKIKKPAFLVALRVMNGNFFHVLKLVALFL